uniref:Rho-GAP domain-containing protein n=1 Tax=Panagrellus redivivus TaxID=6233 RepID=A0A7E4VRX0_PANRE
MIPKQLDVFVNMLGEFVALNKTPDYRLNSASEQYLADAVKAEKKQSTSNITSINIGMNDHAIYHHSRSTSTNSAPPAVCNYEAPSPKIRSSRRLSMPNFRKSSLLKKFQRHSHLEVPTDRRNSDTISESDESVAGDLPLKTKRQRHESTSSSLLGDIAKYCNGMSAIHTKI